MISHLYLLIFSWLMLLLSLSIYTFNDSTLAENTLMNITIDISYSNLSTKFSFGLHYYDFTFTPPPPGLLWEGGIRERERERETEKSSFTKFYPVTS
jgi:hypothetical protein